MTTTKKKHGKQEAAFDFLRSCGANGEFKLLQLTKATGWTTSTAETHIGKHYLDWVRFVAGDKYCVLPEFQSVTKEQFITHCSQVKRLFTKYTVSRYSALSIFEFLLPMSRETQLRATLDALFYEDTLAQRFDEIGDKRLSAMLPRTSGETSSAYRSRLTSLVSNWFGGYSISLVNGRFRAASLRTRKDALAHQEATGKGYLIDETTAVVRFIVPIEISKLTVSDAVDLPFTPAADAVLAVAARIREFFFALFVEAVIRIVNGEDVIWLLEDSPLGRLLHTWDRG